ncbi:MAG: alpha-1,2-fucosyltransferase [Synergistaceae bacterium]|nr:alpha-1,2-fucosyltransferase [Synergistaceae bacterium]
MIIARIIPHAGLGNQLFMYAAGLSASQRLNTELRLGAWDFERLTTEDRPYQLNLFPNINEPCASFLEILRVGSGRALLDYISRKQVKKFHVFSRLIRKLANKFLISRAYYSPSWVSYDDDFLNIKDNNYISGYFKSEKIFIDIAELVRKKFTFAAQCFNPELVSRVQSCNSVALHVRRTDKMKQLEHIDPNHNYIKYALTKIFTLTSNPEFFVFSDDINWCKENLSKIYPDARYNFIENQTPAQDMALMTKCRHVIMGASTFSWWGAWLNENPEKIIIAPDVNLWYLNVKPDRKYLLPECWIKIS